MPGSQDTLTELASDQVAGSLSCHLCGRKYKSRTSLKAHLKANHKIGCSEPKIKCHYPDCEFRCYKLNQLVNHLTDIHRFAVQFQSLCFYSKEEFFNWKQEEEQRQNCFWYHSKSYKLTDNYVDVFSCNRSGHPKISVRERKRQLKAHGYIKCGNICISHLRLTHFFRSKKPKTYHLSYLKTHSGHTLETDETSKSSDISSSFLRLSSAPQTPLDELHSKSLSSLDSIPNAQLTDDTTTLSSCTPIDCESDQMLNSLSEKISSPSSLSVCSNSLSTAPLPDTSLTVNNLTTDNMSAMLNSYPTASSLNTSLANALLCSKLDESFSQFPDTQSNANSLASTSIANSTEVLSFHNYAAKPPQSSSPSSVSSTSTLTTTSTSAASQSAHTDSDTKMVNQTNNGFLLTKSNSIANRNGNENGSFVLLLQTDNSSPIALRTIQSPTGSTIINPQLNQLAKTTPIILQSTSPANGNTATITSNQANGIIVASTPTTPAYHTSQTTGNSNNSNGSIPSNTNQSFLQRQSEVVRQRVQARIQKIMSNNLLLHQLNELDQFLTSYSEKHCSR